MVTESFNAIALPHSRAVDADFHVSVFVAPRLTPDGAEGELSEFATFQHWVRLLRPAGGRGGFTIELSDQNGVIDSKPLLDVIDAEAWDAVFPEDTPVRGPTPPDWGDRHWRTFRAAEIHDGAKFLHAAAMFIDPIAPLAPSDHPLGRSITIMGGGIEGARFYDERIITDRFDQIVGERIIRDRKRPLAAIERDIAAIDEPLGRLLVEMHRSRRFYERPEAQRAYSERPDPDAVLVRPPRPEPDFHERCTFVGDHPTLQRMLGLVIDLRVADLDRLAKSKWLSVRMVVGSLASETTRTTCRATGDDLVTVAESDDWHDGRLRIGNQERFHLLDMDPDGSALKLERYLIGLPRLVSAEENGEPVHASPTALRSTGFTVVRKLQAISVQDRITRQAQIAAELAGRPVPLLSTEDVTQGYRVEVWDDTAAAWYSLHERRIDARVVDHGKILDDAPETSFVQGTTATETPDVEDSPVHIHEAMFGWNGWSLGGPRPGKRVRHEDGDEVVEDQYADPDPVTPLMVRPEVEPGTLPRLRYGRSYAFRVWATDLAGNSRAHQNGPVPPPQPDLVSTVASHLASRRDPLRPAGYLEPLLRSSAAEIVVRRRVEPAPGPPRDLPDDLTRLDVADAVIGRIAERRGDRTENGPIDAVARSSLVARAFSDVVLDEAQPFLRETMSLDPAVIARIVGGPDDLVAETAPLDLVTPLRPFLRWDPVQPPAMVARGRYTEGESLRQVVLRSGVTQDPVTLDLTVTTPDVYGPDHAALDYGPTSERHLIPPKTSQSESELHGAFDTAIGSTDPADHARMLAVALRESGTLFDVEVRRLDDPTQFDPQQGIALLTDPDVPVAERRTLPIPAGDAPVPGQYVVHDTDQLRLPYLPDVVARGISLVFPEAGRDRRIPFPFGTEGFTAPYPGDWPEREPFRLVLANSDLLDGALAGTTLTIGLPPGDVQRFRLSSSLAKKDLDLFGLWRTLPPIVTSNPDVIEAAADGWLWAFTPFEEVTLVHAVPRPLEVPRPIALAPFRTKAATNLSFAGAVDIHGPSTESLTLSGHWIDPVDDLNLPAPEDRPQRGVAFTTRIRPEEDIAVLAGGDVDTQVDVPGFGPVWVHRAVHELGDTRHHTIHYRFRATTRFEEYFAPETLEGAGSADPGDPSAVVDDGRSVVGPETTINVLSTAIPAAPKVHSVIPLFRWDDGTEAEQPVARRRRRRSGLRIYLERPWYSSGEGELLGVLLAPAGNDVKRQGHVSGWGSDPVWRGAPIVQRGAVALDNLMHVLGLDDRPGDATPVVAPASLPLTTLGGEPTVVVLGYRPQYNADRRLWYVDIAVDPGATMAPFVQLAVARYQPDSVAGCHLSAPVLCDFTPLTPERTTSVSRTDVRHVRVVVSGPVGLRSPADPDSGTPFPSAADEFDAAVGANRKVIARLQRIDSKIPTDLGWRTVDVRQLTVRGRGVTDFEAAWVGTLEADRDLKLQRPGRNKRWRVTIEEWEMLPGDKADLGDRSRPPKPPVWEERLVYADELLL